MGARRMPPRCLLRKGTHMLDLSGLMPEARPIVQQVAEVYLKYLSPWFVGLIAHGSAVKGGFIPGCSDVGLQPEVNAIYRSIMPAQKN